MKIKCLRDCKNNNQIKLLLMLVLLAAFICISPGNAHACIQVVKHQHVSLIVETFVHQGLTSDSTNDSFISENDSKKDESSSKDEEDDEEEDDDWEA